MQTIKLFTDGSCRGNPGPGGWAFIYQDPNQTFEMGGYAAKTTNNRMELLSVIKGLEYALYLKCTGPIEILLDSSYVKKGALEWVLNWKQRNWKTINGTDVVNRDLWEQLDSILSTLRTKKVNLVWTQIKGHSGIPGNEQVDYIATRCADQEPIDFYNGPTSQYPINLNDTPLITITAKKIKLKQPFYISVINGVLEKHSTWAECQKRVLGIKAAKFKKISHEGELEDTLKKWN